MEKMLSNVEKLNSDVEMEPKKKGIGWGFRHIQACLLFFVISISTSVRTSLNIAVLAMTDQDNNHTEILIYDWNKEIQGYILSSPMWGSFLIQALVGGYIHRYGGKLFMTYSTGVTGILMILTPLCAHIGGWGGVCLCIGLQGLFHGLLFPTVHTLLGQWVPVSERTRLGMFAYSGIYFGLIFSPPVSAFIGTSSYGWPWIFYMFGAQSVFICILWHIYGASTPAEHKMISIEEKQFIEDSLNVTEQSKCLNTPWKSIITSKPFLGLLMAQIGANWGFTVIFNESASYFKLALGVELQNSGLLTSFGNVAALIITFITSCVADYLLNRDIVSITKIRKCCNTLGTWGPACCLIAVSYVPTDNIKILIGFIILTTAIDGITSCGFFVNHIDLSPNFAGVLVGLASAISDGICIFCPIVTGLILGDDTSNLDKWRQVFLLSASMYFLGNIMFLIFGSGVTQPWNNLIEKPTVDEDKSKEEASMELLVKKENCNNDCAK